MYTAERTSKGLDRKLIQTDLVLDGITFQFRTIFLGVANLSKFLVTIMITVCRADPHSPEIGRVRRGYASTPNLATHLFTPDLSTSVWIQKIQLHVQDLLVYFPRIRSRKVSHAIVLGNTDHSCAD